LKVLRTTAEGATMAAIAADCCVTQACSEGEDARVARPLRLRVIKRQPGQANLCQIRLARKAKARLPIAPIAARPPLTQPSNKQPATMAAVAVAQMGAACSSKTAAFSGKSLRVNSVVRPQVIAGQQGRPQRTSSHLTHSLAQPSPFGA
jgi:hypothetical protein